MAQVQPGGSLGHKGLQEAASQPKALGVEVSRWEFPKIMAPNIDPK